MVNCTLLLQKLPAACVFFLTQKHACQSEWKRLNKTGSIKYFTTMSTKCDMTAKL